LPRPEPATLTAHNRSKNPNALIADSERNMPRNKKSKRRQTLCKESRARQILNQGGEHYSKNRERRHVRRNRSEKNQELWLTPHTIQTEGFSRFVPSPTPNPGCGTSSAPLCLLGVEEK
jgi:hypothetical protein